MAADAQSPDLRVEPKEPDKSLGELFADLTGSLGDLVRTEIELAKTETKDEVSRAGKGAGMFAGAGLEAYLMLLFLSFALAWLLDNVMPTELAFAIVAVLHGIVAFVLYKTGRSKLAEVQGMPQTVGSLKEDAQWARAQKS
jgi:uncharacterized membrane protein YqjE